MPAISRFSDQRIVPLFFGLLIISIGIISLAVMRSPVSESSGYPLHTDQSAQVQLVNPKELCQKIGYPNLAKDAGIEGTVSLCLKVSHTGVITDLEVLTSDHPLLEFACVKNLHYGQFQPGMREELPVSGQLTVSFTFETMRSYPVSL